MEKYNELESRFSSLLLENEKLRHEVKDLQEEISSFITDNDTIPMDIVNDAIDNDISIVAAYERKCERLGTAIWEAYQFIGASLEMEHPEQDTIDMMDKLCSAIGLKKDDGGE